MMRPGKIASTPYMSFGNAAMRGCPLRRGLVLGGQRALYHQEVRAPVAEALHEPEHDGEQLHGHRVVRRAGVGPGVEVAWEVDGLLQA